MSINLIHFVIGMVSFLLTNIFYLLFAGQFQGDRIENSLFLRVANMQFHIHHRLIGLCLLIMCVIIETYIIKDRTILLTILKGFALGSLFHGLIMYTDYLNLWGTYK